MSKHLDTNMTEGSIFRQLLFFSLPLLAGNFFQQCYNTVDSIVLGNFVGQAVQTGLLLCSCSARSLPWWAF